MPSGINPSLGCSPLTGCTDKDYYLPGKGVWAPKQEFNKAKIGAGIGVVTGAYLGARSGNPMYAALGAVGGLWIGHEIGATLDKIDQVHATVLLKNSLHNNANGQTSQWTNPNKNVAVTATPITVEGNCREFITTIKVGDSSKQMKGTACFHNNEWTLKELSE